MTEYQLEDEKSQENLVDGRGMWHRLDKQPDEACPYLHTSAEAHSIRFFFWWSTWLNKSTSEAIRQGVPEAP